MKNKALIILTALLPAHSAFAVGGLSAATRAVSDFNVWFYGFLGVACIGFLIYHVSMAMMEKESWNDVIMALGKVVLAGGIVLAGSWAWSLFGS